jgi:hypothetical protein
MRLKTLMTAAGLTAALAFSGSLLAADKAAAEKAIADAKSTISTAASAGGEWRDSGKMVKAAEKAMAEGDFATAVKMAEKARLQGILGAQQANEQASVGNPDYLY